MQKSYPLILTIQYIHLQYLHQKKRKDGYIEPERDKSTSMVWLLKTLVNTRIISFNSRWEPLVGFGPLSLFVSFFSPIIVSTKQKQRQQTNSINPTTTLRSGSRTQVMKCLTSLLQSFYQHNRWQTVAGVTTLRAWV
jgi:hypothetical protein